MIDATASFLDAIENWVRAVRADDFDAARGHAANIVRTGEAMTNHPEFVSCFKRHYPVLEPVDGLLHFCQVLICATDGRARVLKEWVERNLQDRHQHQHQHRHQHLQPKTEPTDRTTPP